MNSRPADTEVAQVHEPALSWPAAPKGRLVIGSFPLARRFAPPRRTPRRSGAVQLELFTADKPPAG